MGPLTASQGTNLNSRNSEAKEEDSNSLIARSSEIVSGVWDGKYYSGIPKEKHRVQAH